MTSIRRLVLLLAFAAAPLVLAGPATMAQQSSPQTGSKQTGGQPTGGQPTGGQQSTSSPPADNGITTDASGYRSGKHNVVVGNHHGYGNGN